jgi:hypothetical protein
MNISTHPVLSALSLLFGKIHQSSFGSFGLDRVNHGVEIFTFELKAK